MKCGASLCLLVLVQLTVALILSVTLPSTLQPVILNSLPPGPHKILIQLKTANLIRF